MKHSMQGKKVCTRRAGRQAGRQAGGRAAGHANRRTHQANVPTCRAVQARGRGRRQRGTSALSFCSPVDRHSPGNTDIAAQ